MGLICNSIYPQLVLLRNPSKYVLQVMLDFLAQYVLPVPGYPYHLLLKVINGMLRPYNPRATVIHEKALLRRAPLPRLTASRFPPASKLTGIQREFL